MYKKGEDIIKVNQNYVYFISLNDLEMKVKEN